MIAGLFASTPMSVFGFVGGVNGLLGGHVVQLTEDMVDCYRGQGGYDLLGRSSEHLHGTENFEKIHKTCTALKLNSLVLIGYEPHLLSDD